MLSIHPCQDAFSLEKLAHEVRQSSNFRFSWQFYRYEQVTSDLMLLVRQALDMVTTQPDCYRFLEKSFEPLYEKRFWIKPVHEHCTIRKAAGEFENILASAAGDHLGAYSNVLRVAADEEKDQIKRLFNQAGTYVPFMLMPGKEPGCQTCAELNHDLFTSWFFGVAWDWTLLAIWPETRYLWMGCLTDTD